MPNVELQHFYWEHESKCQFKALQVCHAQFYYHNVA